MKKEMEKMITDKGPCPDCIFFTPHAWGIMTTTERGEKFFVRIEAKYCPNCGRELRETHGKPTA